jgi:hypothetical protein
MLLKKQFPEINNSTFELLKNELDGCFFYSLIVFRQNVHAIRSIKSKKLMVTGEGFITSRIFCASWRYAGGEVTGFMHGNSFAWGYSPGMSIKTLPLLDHYVTVSAGHKDILQQAADDFSYGLKNGDITFMKQSVNEHLFSRLQKGKPAKKIRKIMLVGCPLRDVYYPFFPNIYVFTQLDLEIKLIKLLRSSGFYVIYKPHPVTMDEAEGVHSEYADEVLTSRFEEVYDKADCILYGNCFSTTFAFSLFTNKPIVFFTSKWDYWHPMAFELMKKRCSVVEVEAVDGRIVFDEKDLLNAIENSLENINYEVLHEFAF